MPPEAVWSSLAAVLGLVLGGGVTYALVRRQDRLNLHSAENRVRDIVSQADKNAENILKEAELKAKDEYFKKRDEFNREVERFKHEQREQERRLEKREDGIEQQHQEQQKKERHLQHSEKKLHERREHLEQRVKHSEELVEQQKQKLHEITGLSRDQAEKTLLERLERELSGEVASRIQRHEESLKVTTEERARKVLAVAIQRYAAEHTADTTVSTVD